MLSWLQTNLGSIAVALVLLIAATLIVRRMILDKKAGKHLCGGSCSSCAGGCSGCSMQGCCHGK
jgi:hypothetical protein